jgi:hypothetical protein
MNGRAMSAVRLCLTAALPELVVVANGAGAMQTGRCGHRAGIPRSFRETLATRFPNLRQRSAARDGARESSTEMPFDTSWGERGQSLRPTMAHIGQKPKNPVRIAVMPPAAMA